MKFIDGSSYAQVRSRMPLHERLRALTRVAAAIDYAHAQSLWHRDLKPDNIMVGDRDELYVVDWGLVSVVPGAQYRLELPKVALPDSNEPLPEVIDTLLEDTPEVVANVETGKKKILGTLLYMAPEQASDDESAMGTASDVWAQGVMLYEALHERHPYIPDPFAPTFEMIARVLTAEIPSAQPGVPIPAVPTTVLCDHMLSRSTRIRPTMSEVYSCLSSVERTLAGSPMSTSVQAIFDPRAQLPTPLFPPGIGEPPNTVIGAPYIPATPLQKTVMAEPTNQCTACGTEFAISYGFCPVCGTRRTPAYPWQTASALDGVRGDSSNGHALDEQRFTLTTPAGFRLDGVTAEVLKELAFEDTLVRAIAVTTPSGYRIEGLPADDLDSVVELLATLQQK